ncbi:hypothetical protein Dimus_013825 [Dionaea muscipula]
MQLDQVLEEQMGKVSQLYPGLYTITQVQSQTQRGEAKPKRRRRKRNNEGLGKKRKLSLEQVHLLELSFGHEHKLETERKDRLASELGLDPRQVAVWFQNRRARWKSKKLEEEFSKLRTEHDNIVVEKCRLQAELLQLKEQLNDAQKVIQTLSERSADHVSAHSPSCSLTMKAMDPWLLLGEFGLGYDNMFYGIDQNPYISSIEWDLCI